MKKVEFTDDKSSANTTEQEINQDINDIQTPREDNYRIKKEHPYMGNLTSHEIGMMANSKEVSGDLFKRMISNIEQDTDDGPILP